MVESQTLFETQLRAVLVARSSVQVTDPGGRQPWSPLSVAANFRCRRPGELPASSWATRSTGPAPAPVAAKQNERPVATRVYTSGMRPSVGITAVLGVAVALIVSVPANTAENPPSIFVSPTGSDVDCARGAPSRPCGSFNRAYALAVCGDVIQVAGGTYPASR